ncbi:universal stress protein A [Deltaproteobacteria bacterium]|nr:universal stress protein A [Deltaproteobacteria bacterium]
MNSRINIFFALDANYLPHTVAAMASVLSNAKEEETIHFYLASEDIDSHSKAKIAELKKIKDCSVEYPILPANWRDIFSGVITYGCINVYAYLKLLIPAICPELERILYLDGDTIARGSLAELYNTDMEDFYFAGVEDFDHKIHRPPLGYADCFPYINCGVVLVNNKKILADHPSYIVELGNKIKGSKLPLESGAQNVLNCFFHTKIKQIGFKWNCHLSQYFTKIKSHSHKLTAPLRSLFDKRIIHFAGGKHKPWLPHSRHPNKALYARYQAMTPWADVPASKKGENESHVAEIDK